MPSNPTGFRVTDTAAGWNATDLDDIFVRKDCFLEGGLWLWGNAVRGRLGTSSSIAQSSPVQTISGGTNWRQVSLGFAHSAAIKADGTLWLWGCNSVRQLGDGTTIDKSSPVQTISTGNDWKQISLGCVHSAAIKTDGTLWLWGFGNNGQLGANSRSDFASPVQTISGGNNWRQVSLGGSHSAAIKTDGTLWLWGDGISGQLGNNSTANQSSPVQTVSGGTNWRQVSLGGVHSAAIKTDGTLWLWGDWISGQLGNNSTANQSSPVQTVSGGTNWRQVSLGGFHSAAIKTDGTLWLWGSGSFGQLGTNSTANQSSPVQTISGGTNWRQISLGGYQSAAIKTDGALWLWGAGFCGQLGNNSTANQSSPVQTISVGTNWRQVSLGVGLFSHTAAIREDCW